jgi:exopolyphosphatase/guanosine-5'-triphosphate,3'-diphosphate pyrophosphatase
VREASNGRVFVRRVRERLRLPLRIISGREEARLIYLGVLQAVRFRRPTAIVTIGGGSAQVMSGDGTRLHYAASVPLGGARLAQRFIRHDPPRPVEVGALRAYVDRAWVGVVRTMRRHRRHTALGSSATIYQLMAAAELLRRGREKLPAKHRFSISRSSLERLIEWLAASTAAERIQLPGLDPRREDLALPTAVALLAWMEGCGVGRLRYAPGSLREGLVVDYLIKHHRRASRRLASSAGLAEPANGNGRFGAVPRRLLEAGVARLRDFSEKP